jgi:hypothetical protein
MTTLSALFRNGPWIWVPLFCISVALLGYLIRNVIRLVRQAHIFSVPLREQQEIEFTEAGRVVLCGEGPFFSVRFARLDFELSTDAGTAVKGRTAWFHARTSGFSRVRIELKSFVIPRPGRYLLRVLRMSTVQEADAEHRIVFMRPHLIKSLGYVIGIILAAGLMIASIVFFGLGVVSSRS